MGYGWSPGRPNLFEQFEEEAEAPWLSTTDQIAGLTHLARPAMGVVAVSGDVVGQPVEQVSQPLHV
jgi:hypothetical protein